MDLLTWKRKRNKLCWPLPLLSYACRPMIFSCTGIAMWHNSLISLLPCKKCFHCKLCYSICWAYYTPHHSVSTPLHTRRAVGKWMSGEKMFTVMFSIALENALLQYRLKLYSPTIFVPRRNNRSFNPALLNRENQEQNPALYKPGY